MFDSLLHLVFPKLCISCNREGTHFCEDCFALLSIANTPSVLSEQTSLAGLFCALSFEDPLAKRLIHSLKYQPFLKELASPLAYSIIAHLSFIDNQIIHPQGAIRRESGQKDSTYLLCPIPLHKKRLKWRGFNHAEEIAKALSHATQIPMHSDILVRTKNTPPQVSLKKEERIRNMQGVFQVPNAKLVQGKKVLLLDDVFTTGATMEECARVLKQAGAKQVWGVVVARG